MGGWPIEASENYTLARDKAKEVIDMGVYSLQSNLTSSMHDWALSMINLFSMNPIKKSHRVRSGDYGGHFIFTLRSEPQPIHLFGSF